MSDIKITLPDGSVKEFPAGVTALDIAKSISSRLAKEAIVAKVDGVLVDLTRPINADANVELLDAETPEGLEVLRHSAAHLMAQAIRRLYPDVKLAIGPVVDNRFYYDLQCDKAISSEDFPAIEAEMERIVKEKLPIERVEVAKERAYQQWSDENEPFKLEILEDLEDGHITIYKQGEFTDLCRGPHVPNTSYLKATKLLSVAGAYWRGDADRQMLQRIYGTAWPKKSQLDAWLRQQEEAAKRDHRKLGQELDLFSFREEAPGFIFWHPKGWTLYRLLEQYSRELQAERGYSEVATPWILRSNLWEQSGHWQHYRDDMFIIANDEEPMACKPMNCPAHCLLYKTETRSYRDLPIKMSEYGPLSRFEKSGTLHGALRVRGFHQDDAHLFVRPDQIKDQIKDVLEIVDLIYTTFGMPYTIKLSTRPDDFMGEIEVWDKAETALVDALTSLGREYVLNPGDGAFYGPKLDFDVTDAIGRTWQCATVQLDFQLPIRFDLTYVDADGKEKRPVMIHRAIMGTLERFVGVLVEHYAGAFPLWLSPVQVKVLSIGDAHTAYAEEVGKVLKEAGIRVEVDTRGEKIGYKIRQAQMEKIPYMLVVGDKEVENRQVAVRQRTAGDKGAIPLDDFVALVKSEVAAKK
ncbi:MAG: threonine--tRNA ligase [Limnochordia bacterium]|jgi:threonyl-tRNA synthetase